MRVCNGVYIDAEYSNCELNAGKVCMGYGYFLKDSEWVWTH